VEGGVPVVVALLVVAIMGDGMDIWVEDVATPTQITSHDKADGFVPTSRLMKLKKWDICIVT
jgi:hypothetical protein